MYKAIHFPRTHDTERLIALLTENIWLSLSIEKQRRLTADATTTRYPREYEAIPGWHVRIQPAFHGNTDNAVSKTVNSPFHATVEDVDKIQACL